MDNEFRTTFIPKKPVVPQTASLSNQPIRRPVGLLFVISVLIFVITVAVGGGMYGYKVYLENDVDELVTSLQKVQKTIDPNTIKEFSVMDKRLRNAETLLAQHTVMYPLFEVLRTTTLPQVRYTQLDISFDESKNVIATISGESDGYRSIALQSQALAKSTSLKDIIFSNFVVNPKGRVSFNVSFMIPKNDAMFNQYVLGTLSQVSSNNQATVPDTALEPVEAAAIEETVVESSSALDGVAS